MRNFVPIVVSIAFLVGLVACYQRHADRPSHQVQTQGRLVKASYYGPGFAGKKTASGEVFDPQEHTAAHRTLPFGTRVRVTHPDTKKTVMVTINDRGPFVPGRVLDLSQGAAQELGLEGVEKVHMEIVS